LHGHEKLEIFQFQLYALNSDTHSEPHTLLETRVTDECGVTSDFGVLGVPRIPTFTCPFNKCLGDVVDVDQSEPYNLFGLCLREEVRKLGDAF
jgi:hypothetical protein